MTMLWWSRPSAPTLVSDMRTEAWGCLTASNYTDCTSEPVKLTNGQQEFLWGVMRKTVQDSHTLTEDPYKLAFQLLLSICGQRQSNTLMATAQKKRTKLRFVWAELAKNGPV
ncbi:hypothetical protein RRG08_031831 [Elysia crispata]|uniref:Uncharacterized protein n=1 Tax=Elysia crispata TaxID=231223 RepID=A0AAE0Y6J9_9GAST|nr:hypothetical protein RRG08_031831 [Elysia crispata]